MLPELEYRDIEVGSVTLHTAVAGPEDGPLVLLLHGFPEFWYSWRALLGPLIEAGYRVAAPDLRGYDRSSKPPTIADYSRDLLVQDVVGLITALGRDKAHVVCHDWGGVVGWALALQHPERVERFCVMNIPHPIAFAKALRTLPQLRRSWYVFLFQLPWLPEWLFRRRDFAWPVWALTVSSPPGTWTEADLDRYRDAWSQPGAAGAMINWYRAAARVKDAPLRTRRVAAPTLLLWGDQDVALGADLADASIAYCDDGRLVRFPDAGHFVQHDAADRVQQLVIEFLDPN